MKLKGMFLVAILALASVTGLIGGPAHGATINFTASDVVSNWLPYPDSLDGLNTWAWSVSGSAVYYGSNDGQALVSNFAQSNSFSFSTRIMANNSDDDRYGLTFGFQNSLNNYRFSWEGNFYNGGYAEADGSRGLSLIKEVGGVSTSLINLSSTFWQNGVSYDVTVYRSGNNIGMTVQQVGGGTVASWQGTDTTFMSGAVGLWNASQNTFYSNIALNTPVPLPGALLLFGPGLVGLAALRRRLGK